MRWLQSVRWHRGSGPLVIVSLDKPAGWTPLRALEHYRAATPAVAGVPMVYAGRLDPMAEGVLLVLAGDDRFALSAHLLHDKEYVATFLFGVSSDTYDALGRLRLGAAPDAAACAASVAALGGVHPLSLPPWSAFRVRGRPLHRWASEGRLGEIEVPTRDMVVVEVTGVHTIQAHTVAFVADATARILRVEGDFRQRESARDWGELVRSETDWVAVEATLTVRSGTYVRALAQALGERLGCGALLFRLRRTRVGPHHLADAIRLDDPA